jgi:hypothetical protein
MSDTPRTDAEALPYSQGPDGRRCIRIDFARTLERELNAAKVEIERMTTLRSASEWRDDDGDVLWWRVPIQEAPYVGSPLECGWFEDFYTHWTPLPKVKEPK